MIAEALDSDFSAPPKEQPPQVAAGAEFKHAGAEPPDTKAGMQMRLPELLDQLLQAGHNGSAVNARQFGEFCDGGF